MSEWISVEDRNPVECKHVLCCTRHGHRFIGMYYSGEWHDEDDLLRDPSHWMPLPESPK